MGELGRLRQIPYADPKTGRTVYSINMQGRSVRHHGYSANEWTHDSKKIVVNVVYDRLKTADLCDIVLFDTENMTETVLRSNVAAGSGNLSHNDIYFYRGGIYNSSLTTETLCHQIYSVDLKTLEEKKIFDQPYAICIDRPISVTNDGKMLGIAVGADKRIISTVDTLTEEVKNVFNQNLTYIFDEKMLHVQINPKNPEYILFCRGGANCMSDWIWVLNTKTGDCRNIFKHQLTKDGRNGEDVGHEVWSHDGEWVWFVKYSHSQYFGGNRPAGIYRVSRNGDHYRCINSDYDYWHVGVSPDGRFIAADVRPVNDITKIVLIDTETGKSELLCEFYVVAHSVWGHPHPTFSPDGKKISFFYSSPDGMESVGYVHV